jgi:hypothetical protein
MPPPSALASSVPAVFRWEPRPDITVYELALCLPCVVPEPVALPELREHARRVSALPDAARRHFTPLPLDVDRFGPQMGRGWAVTVARDWPAHMPEDGSDGR